ncbi:MAG: HAD-IIIA family hydrolase [Lachnospiraceae bacterium]|nr:HAD-IIIA family hydrolase [Lachnospiraceae bacterium]
MSDLVSQAVIIAGGRGERLRPFTDTAPKPLFPIGGVPFINRLLEQIASFGIRDIVILLGYRADQVIDEVGDGSRFGVNVRYDVTPEEYDTGQRLMHSRDMLGENFLMMYCDNYCPVDFDELCRTHSKNSALITLSVYANKDKYTKDNIIVKDNRVLLYDKKRLSPDLSGVDIGYAIVNRSSLDLLGDDRSFSSVYPKLVDQGKLFALVTEHRYYSIGGYERLPLTEEFFREKKVVFLDRDGTINVRPPKACYIERPEDFQWLPGAKEALKKLHDNNVITILISNQPGIARGNLTEETLGRIHEKMQSDLEVCGCRIDHIYYCPHGWDDGCECRKPRPGMLYMAQRDLSLDLTKCILFGDDERDIEAGSAARVRSVLVSEEYSFADAVNDYLKGDIR